MTEEALFHEALAKPPAERAAYLDKACAGQPGLRASVEALLAAHEAPASILDKPDAALSESLDSVPGLARIAAVRELTQEVDPQPAMGETAELHPSIGVGGLIAGRYMLQQKIGEGGMGEVWVARQTSPVKRKVALKLIKAGMDSKAMLARFEQERQALAMMDHPNIARVLDGGMTPTGQPFFVMELVNGLPLNKFCDEAKMTPKERLELFVPICQAVQHAHQKGIVHRDLKPANILVTMIDGKPVPKVIDFGVAKATGGKITEGTMSTNFGGVIGTLEYMSPEQAGFSNVDIDTRADIYSLGVILYQLLTGLVPIDSMRLKSVALAEMIRLIQEEEPSKPSTRLSTDQSLPSLAALRQTEPKRLMSMLRGELDWVVMKCLEKQRDRRYDTVNALSRDIQRYLADEPVEARPPSAGYRLKKFVKRNRRLVMAASLVLLAVVGGIAGTTIGLFVANRALLQRNVAEHIANEREQARAAAEYERDQKERARAMAETALYFNRVNSAAQCLQSDNWIESRRLLDLCPSQSRGWEWHYLDRLHRTALQSLPGLGQFGATLQLSKDGRRLAAFSPYGDDGAVRVWDLAHRTALAEIKGPGNGRRFTCSALGPDGRTVAMGDESGAVGFWDAETGQMTREFTKLPRWINSISFSSDGRWLAAARADSRSGEMLLPFLEAPRHEDLIVWEVVSGAEVFHPRGFGFVAAFSPDAKRLLTFKMNTGIRMTTATPETFVALFDTSNWTELKPGMLGSASSFAFNASGQQLALGGLDRTKDVQFIRIFDVDKGAELMAPWAMGSRDIALSPDGSTLALTKGMGLNEIELWDVKTKRQERSLRWHSNTVSGIAFTPEGKLLSCSWDKTVKLWDPAGNAGVRQLVAPSSLGANPAVLTPGGELLAFSESNSVNLLTGPVRTITLVELETNRRLPPAAGGSIPISKRTLTGTAGGTLALAFSNNGQRLASGGRTGEVTTWDLTNLTELGVYRGHRGEVSALAMSPDGRQVASACEPQEITRARFGQAKFPAVPIPVAVKVWDAELAKEQLTLDGHMNGVNQLAFSPDGRWLASASDQEARIWDLTSGKLLRELDRREFQSGTRDAMAFSARGNLLVTAGKQVVQLWDATSGQSVAVFQGHQGGKLAVAISPDQSRVASAAGAQVKIWSSEYGLEALSLPLSQIKSGERVAYVAALSWSTDGQRLRAALSDGSAVEWDASSPAEPSRK